MLDVVPPSSDVTTVEVFLPKDVQGMRMGMPPAATQKTSGTVYAVVDKVTADVSGGHARILLQPRLDHVGARPARARLQRQPRGGDATRSSRIRQGRSSCPTRRATRSRSSSSAITEVPVAGATTGGAAGGPRLARWSKTALDDTSGDCIAVLHDNGRGGFDGDFFSAGDDLDCDGAMPECDDTWFLHVEGAGHCVTDMVPSDPFMGACQLGTTAGCVDNNANSGVCTPIAQVVCAPSAFCNDCSDRTLEMSGCLANAAMSDASARIECELLVADDGNGGGTLCLDNSSLLDMAPLRSARSDLGGATRFRGVHELHRRDQLDAAHHAAAQGRHQRRARCAVPRRHVRAVVRRRRGPRGPRRRRPAGDLGRPAERGGPSSDLRRAPDKEIFPMKRLGLALVLALGIAASSAWAQQPSPAARWEAWQSLIGFWVGEEGPGQGATPFEIAPPGQPEAFAIYLEGFARRRT